MEELTEIQVDPNDSSCVVKIGKGLKKELGQQLAEFLSFNQDVFAWTRRHGRDPPRSYVPPVEHWQAKPVHQKWKALDVDRYKAL